MRDFLKAILERAEFEGGEVLGRAEVAPWPRQQLDRLVEMGVLRAAERAGEVEYRGCERGCAIAADFQEDPATAKQVCVHRCAHGCGRVVLGAEEFDRWSLDLAGLARAVAKAVGASGDVVEVIPSRLVSAGFIGDVTGTRQVYLALGLGWPGTTDLLRRTARFVASSAECFVLAAGRAPPADVWPDRMNPAVAVLSEHLHLDARGLTLNLEAMLGQECVPHPKAQKAPWLTNKTAARMLLEAVSGLSLKPAAARVSIAGKRREFRTNGKKGKDHRIEPATFYEWLEKQRQRDLAKSD